MGTNPQYRPKLLPEKLRRIREILGARTYDDMVILLDLPRLRKNSILRFENGERVPGLDVLIRYSELSGLTINELVDDRIELSKRLLGVR